MNRQPLPKNLFVREVEPKRKSCPRCATKKVDMHEPAVFAVGEYLAGKWYNAIDRCCSECFATHIDNILRFAKANAPRKVAFVGKHVSLPMFLEVPAVYADLLEEEGKPNTANLYRELAKVSTANW